MENLAHVTAKYTVYIIIGYIVLVFAIFFFQRNLLYHPDRTTPSPEQLGALGLKFWPATSNFKGMTNIHPPRHPAVGTVVVFHGNAGSALHRSYYVDALAPLGYHVILAEYPGYGGRSGKMNEKSFIHDAQEIIFSARSDYGHPIYLIGESLGCGIVAAVANRTDFVAGLVLITPWDSFANIAQTHYWYLPARWLVKDKYDSIRNLRSFDHPVAVAMASNDEIIPNKHTINLYNAIKSPKQLWEFKNAGHNSWPTAHSAKWWKEAMQFISRPN